MSNLKHPASPPRVDLKKEHFETTVLNESSYNTAHRGREFGPEQRAGAMHFAKGFEAVNRDADGNFQPPRSIAIIDAPKKIPLPKP